MKTPRLIREQRPSSSLTQAETGQALSPLTAFIVAAVLAAGLLAIYWPSLDFQFILDDHRFVSDPRLQSSGHVWEYFTSYVWAQVAGGPLSFYRPVFVLWLRLNVILSGSSPWGWHLLSILKHASVAVLLGLLVWKLLRDRVAALLAAALFALHPAQTESVAWVTVPDPLMSAAVLGSLLLYFSYADYLSADSRFSAGRLKKKSRKPPSKLAGKSSTAWIVASSAACLVALMTKETALVLPFVLFVLALIVPFDKNRNNDDRKEAPGGNGTAFRIRLVSAVRQTLPFLGATVVYLLLRVSALHGQFSPPTQHLPWKTVLLSAPATLWFYVKVLFWPVRSRAFADPTLADTFSLRGVLLPALGVGCALVILTGACFWTWRRTRNLPDQEALRIRYAFLLGTLILLLPILLALNLNALNPGDFLHGRYTYLPLTGLMLLLATGYHLAEKAHIVMLSAAAIVAAAFCLLTVQQEGAWKDDLTVFTVAHENAPHNAPVAQHLADTHVQAALALDGEGRCDQAMPIFDQVIQEYSNDWFAWAGRGECFFKLGDLPSAEQALRRASELSHEPRVIEQWQELRARMGLPPAPLK
jgi:hypothetical protein